MSERTLKEHLVAHYHSKALEPAALAALRGRLGPDPGPPLPGPAAGDGTGTRPGMAFFRRLAGTGASPRLAVLGLAGLLTGLLAFHQDRLVEFLAGFVEPEIVYIPETGEAAIDLVAGVAAWVHRGADEAWYRQEDRYPPKVLDTDPGILLRVPGEPALVAARWALDHKSYRSLSRNAQHYLRPDLMPPATWRLHRDGSGRRFTSVLAKLRQPDGRALANHFRRRVVGDLVVISRLESGLLQCLVAEASADTTGWSRIAPASGPVQVLDRAELLGCAAGPLLPFKDPATGKAGLMDPCGRIVVEGLEDVLPGSASAPWEPGDHEFRAAVRRDGLWEFVDRSGRTAFPGRYQEVGIGFVGAYSRIKRDGLWGLVDRAGREPFPPRFAQGELPHLPGVQGWVPAAQDGRWGILLADGAWLVEPAYDEIVPIPGGTEALLRKGGLWGLFHGDAAYGRLGGPGGPKPVVRDPTRNDRETRMRELYRQVWIIPPRYQAIERDDHYRSAVLGPEGWQSLEWSGFHAEGPPVASRTGLYGSDTWGYDERRHLEPGNDYLVRKGSLWGLAEWRGRELIPPAYDAIRIASFSGPYLLAAGPTRSLAEGDDAPVFEAPLAASGEFPEDAAGPWSEGWLPCRIDDPERDGPVAGWLHVGGRFVTPGRVLELTRRPPNGPRR